MSVSVHPPKRETFDVVGRTNTDPKGVVRPVDEYRLSDDVLYMARSADHPRFDYVESWLVPALDLRVTDFHFTPDNEAEQDFYVDVMTFEIDGPVWRTTDLYLDLVCRAEDRTEILDTDELAEAVAVGLVDAATGRRAMDAAFAAALGLAAHRHDLTSWFADLGVDLGPRRR